jgi:hypothetical protein
VNREAQETAAWVVKVMDEAEKLDTGLKLSLQEKAYMLALTGSSRRVLLTTLCQEVFGTNPWVKGL